MTQSKQEKNDAFLLSFSAFSLEVSTSDGLNILYVSLGPGLHPINTRDVIIAEYNLMELSRFKRFDKHVLYQSSLKTMKLLSA